MSKERPHLGAPLWMTFRLTKLGNGFLIVPLLFVDLTEEVMRDIEMRFEVECFPIMFYRAIILTSPVTNPPAITIDYQRKRIKFLRQLDLRNRFLMTSHC